MKSKKILIAEDNETNYKALKTILENAGYSVAGTTNGKDVLALAKLERPDLFLLDINMPGMSGTQAGEALTNCPETKGIPIIYITELLDKEEEQKLKHTLFGQFFFAKPYDTKKILEKIAEII